VYSGTSGGFRASAAGVGQDRSDYPGLSLTIDGALRGGYVPSDSTSPAFAAGLQSSIFALFLASGLEDPADVVRLFAADAYVSLPSSSRRANSLGVTASLWHVMPYFQVGSKDPANGGWYTTQAFLFVNAENCCDVDFADFLWLPSYTWVSADRRPRATHFSLGLGIGRNDGRMLYAFTAGAGMEFFRTKARVR
jgi:hypothetical protein